MQAMMIAGTVLQAVGAVAGGVAADRAGRRNGALLDEQAAETRRATADRENLTRGRNARTLSDQRAALLASGVDPTSGTALIGSGQSAQDAEMDALTLRYEGLMQARGQNMEADNVRYQGRVAKRQAILSAASSLMSGGGKYMSGTQAPAPVETRNPVPSVYTRGAR
jgi:hypothetical protein